MDAQVLRTQKWLNATYGGLTNQGWAPVDEDGFTGWDVINGLIRGLQHELGISPMAGAFGPTTTALFISQIGRIDVSTNPGSVPSTLNVDHLLNLVSGALWCKGCYGSWDGFGSPIAFTDMASSIAELRANLGLTTGVTPSTAFVDVKLMSFLLTMDTAAAGNTAICESQQWLNGMYSSRQDFALIPTDGVYSRPTQTGMLYALQYEFGMADGTANGNFGPGTRAGLSSQALITPGSTDTTHHFVRLFQSALRFNGFTATLLTGTFDTATASSTRAFQTALELPVTGAGDYGTWCALLVSTGDPDQPVTGLDTSTQLTANQATAIRQAGYTHIGRYIVGLGKFIRSEELAALKTAGLKLIPIHERNTTSDEAMTWQEGWNHGIEALERCRVLNIPDGSTVFFAVDYDPIGTSIAGPVTDYFTGVNAAMNAHLCGTYSIGVYGTRNVCQTIIDAGLATTAFVAGMSTGWSGNMGFTMPAKWSYNQIKETTQTFAGTSIDIDHDIVSSKASAVDLTTVTPPPTEKDGTPTDTGYDILYEWTTKAEATCERALRNQILLPGTYVSQLPNYILGWLRKPDYWKDDEGGNFWKAYTPESIGNPNDLLARIACEQELQLLADSTYDIRTRVYPVYRKVAHTAVATLAYLNWGTNIAPDEYGTAELGAWALDLLQLWGQYDRAFHGYDLAQWMAAMIGKSGGVLEPTPPDPYTTDYWMNPVSDLNYADVAGDADAWLLSRKLSGDTSGRALSNAMRTVYQVDSDSRIRRFYQDRFSSSPDNVVAAFTSLTTEVNLGTITVLGKNLFGFVAHAPSMPTPSQALLCAQAYAAFLANPQRP